MSFPKNPVDNQVYVKNGKHFRYESSTNAWKIGKSISNYSDFDLTTSTPIVGDTLSWDGSNIVPAALKLKPAVLATIEDLPSSDNTLGDIALVSENHRVYMWDSTQWREIATANNYPVISTSLPTYTYLEAAAGPVTLNLEAADPEAMPITWSYSIVSGSLGGTTVSLSGSTVTITPSTDSEDINNSFVIRFSVTDGILVENTSTQIILIVVGANAWDISYAAPTYKNYLYARDGATFRTSGASYTTSVLSGYNTDAITYNNDGTKFYLATSTTNIGNYVTFNLTTPYNFDTISSVTELTTTDNASAHRAIDFKSDGTKFYVGTDIALYQRECSTPWTIPSSVTDSGSILGNVRAFTFSSNGLTLAIAVGVDIPDINVYTLSTAWDISTATLSNSYPSIAKPSTDLVGFSSYDRIIISQDGSKLYISTDIHDATTVQYPLSKLYTIPLSTPWDFSTLDYFSVDVLDLKSLAYSDNHLSDKVFNFTKDGSKLLLNAKPTTSAYYRVDQFDLLEDWKPISIDWNEKHYLTDTFPTLTSASAVSSGAWGRFTISPDGTKLYTDDTLEYIRTYTLDYPWNFKSMRFADAFRFEAGRNGAAEGLTIAGDGSRLYRLDLGESITQVMLDDYGYPIDAYVDPTTFMTYDFRSPIIQSSIPEVFDQWFSADGLDYIVLYQHSLTKYRLSAPWDIVTAKSSFTKMQSSMGNIESMCMSPDGHNVYLLKVDNAVEQWYTSEAWNFSKVKYKTSARWNIDAYAGIHFDSTGTYLYTNTSSTIIQNKTATPWNIDALYVAETFDTGYTDIRDVSISSNGTRMHLLRYAGYIDEYILSTPYMVSTATLNHTVDIEVLADAETVGYGDAQAITMKITEDGTTVLIFGLQTDKIQQWTMTTPWDLSTLTWFGIDDVVCYGVNGISVTVTSALFPSPDKTKMWVSQVDDGIIELPLKTTGDFIDYKTDYLSTVGIIPNGSTSLNIFGNGSTYYIGQSDDLYKFELSDPSNLRSAVLTETYLAIGLTPLALRIIPDGSKIFMSNAAAQISYRTLSTPFDFSTMGTQVNYAWAGYSTAFEFNSDGTEVWRLGDTDDYMRVRKLSTPYDVQSYSEEILSPTVIPGASNWRGMRLNPDRSKVFFTAPSDVTWWNMSTPGDITTVYNGLDAYNDSNTIELIPMIPVADAINAFTFKFDGTKFYILGTTLDVIHEFTMTTPWDITTASYTTQSEKLTTVHGVPNVNWECVKFKPDGTKMYLLAVNILYELDMSTAWDLSTLSYSSKTITIDEPIYDMVFTPDGNNIVFFNYGLPYSLYTWPIV